MNPSDSNQLLTGILKGVSRSFYQTLRVLPGAVRSQIALAYLLARTTDTIADTELVPSEQRLQALSNLRNRIRGDTSQPLNLDALARHQGTNPEQTLLHRVEDSLSLLQSFSDFDRREIVSVLDTITSGQEQDLLRFSGGTSQSIRALQTSGELDDYTYKVAGCVGEFWTRMCRRHLFPKAPLDDAQLLARGIRFGKGLQLVNILRDIPADLRIGRCYIPSDQLGQLGMRPGDLLDPAAFEKFRPLYFGWLDNAEQHLREGWDYTNSLPFGQVRVRLACAWPLLIGFETLKLLRSGNVLHHPRKIKVARSAVRGIFYRSVLYYPWPARWRGMAQSRPPAR